MSPSYTNHPKPPTEHPEGLLLAIEPPFMTILQFAVHTSDALLYHRTRDMRIAYYPLSLFLSLCSFSALSSYYISVFSPLFLYQLLSPTHTLSSVLIATEGSREGGHTWGAAGLETARQGATRRAGEEGNPP